MTLTTSDMPVLMLLKSVIYLMDHLVDSLVPTETLLKKTMGCNEDKLPLVAAIHLQLYLM